MGGSNGLEQQSFVPDMHAACSLCRKPRTPVCSLFGVPTGAVNAMLCRVGLLWSLCPPITSTCCTYTHMRRMDIMLGGDLKFHLNKEGRFSLKRSQFYAAEVLLGLEHIHSKGLIYRDMAISQHPCPRIS